MNHKGTFMGLIGDLPMEIMRLNEGDAIDCGGWTWHRVSRETFERFPAGEPNSPKKVSVDRRRRSIIEAVEAQEQAEFDAEDDEP